MACVRRRQSRCRKYTRSTRLASNVIGREWRGYALSRHDLRQQRIVRWRAGPGARAGERGGDAGSAIDPVEKLRGQPLGLARPASSARADRAIIADLTPMAGECIAHHMAVAVKLFVDVPALPALARVGNSPGVHGDTPSSCVSPESTIGVFREKRAGREAPSMRGRPHKQERDTAVPDTLHAAPLQSFTVLHRFSGRDRPPPLLARKRFPTYGMPQRALWRVPGRSFAKKIRGEGSEGKETEDRKSVV